MNGEAKRDMIAAHLEGLLRANGTLTPEIVVADAQDPDSPLHGEFEWDDAHAAHQHRLDQARRIIRKVSLVVVEETRVLKAPAYVRDPGAGEREQGYVSILTCQNDLDKARAVMVTEVGRIKASIARLRSIAAVLGLEDEVIELEARVSKIVA